MLFFINDQQAKMVKRNCFGQQRMGAYGNLHIPRRNAFAYVSCLLRWCHARQHAYFHRKPVKSFGKHLAMLARQ